MDWFKSERQKWAAPRASSVLREQLGLTALDPASRDLYQKDAAARRAGAAP
jgi:hypothetical protein